MITNYKRGTLPLLYLQNQQAFLGKIDMFCEISLKIEKKYNFSNTKLIELEMHNSHMQSTNIESYWNKQHIHSKVCKIKLQLLSISLEQIHLLSKMSFLDKILVCEISVDRIYCLSGNFRIAEYRMLSRSRNAPGLEITIVNCDELGYSSIQ